MALVKLLLILFGLNIWFICMAKRHSWLLEKKVLSENLYLPASVETHRKHDHRKAAQLDVTKIHINTRHSMCLLDRRFLSFAIDALEMKRKFSCFPTSLKKLNRLVRNLSPAYLRLGGTPQDFVSFMDGNEIDVSLQSPPKNCTPRFENWRTMKPFQLSMGYFSDIVQFTHRNGLDLVFGLNELNQRKSDHSWDESESIKLFQYALSHGIPITWELGNEPNRYVKYGKNYTITPSQLAGDYDDLRKLLKNKKIVGPSIATRNPKALKYLKKFLESRPAIDALTYHHYFMHESISTPDKYVDPDFLEQLEEKMYAVKLIMNLTDTTTDLWLGEAGSSSGGGAQNLSDTYAAGFLYLGTLGLASKHCHKIVIRQSLYGGHYGMIDAVTHEPLPDYWTSVLFKKLVGTISLKTHKTNQKCRIYAFCSKENNNDITLVAINFGVKSARFTINNYMHHHVVKYVLTPDGDDLRSKIMRLNGDILKLTKGHNSPTFNGVRTRQPFRLPKKSYGFFVVKNVRSKVCRTS